MPLGSLLKNGSLRFQQRKLVFTIQKHVIQITNHNVIENELIKHKLVMFKLCFLSVTQYHQMLKQMALYQIQIDLCNSISLVLDINAILHERDNFSQITKYMSPNSLNYDMVGRRVHLNNKCANYISKARLKLLLHLT